MSEYFSLMNELRKEQDEKLHQVNRLPDDKQKRLRKKLSKEIEDLGFQQNTLFHVKMELERLSIEDVRINKKGLCSGCHEPFKEGVVVVYRSQRNGTISLFHENCWLKVTPIGPDPIMKFSLWGGL